MNESTLSDAAIKSCKDDFFVSSNTIFERAKQYREQSGFTGEEREIPYYYIILKNFIAEHESRFGSVTIQVFNEHRMALDHFIRAREKCDNGQDNYKTQIKAAVGHLRRAVLDIAKLNCAGLQKMITKKQDAIPRKALGLISNGDYIKKYILLQNNAEETLRNARCNDIKIGSDVLNNEEAVNLYIKAYCAHLDWYKYQMENMGNALYIRTKYYIIAGWPLLATFLLGLVSDFLTGGGYIRPALKRLWHGMMSVITN